MSARSVHDVIAGHYPKARRTFQPVRRNSYHAGEREHRIWGPIADTKANARKLIALRLQAAEFYDRRNKEPGKRNGPLGHIGLEVLRQLYRIVDFKTGRLEPSIDYICGKIRRSRAAVVAAMARLRFHGFLNWIRRTEPTENEGAGPQVRQIPNAYFFGLPERAAAWVKRKLVGGHPPDDDVQRRADAAADMEAMLDTLPVADRMAAIIDDTALAQALAGLGRAIEGDGASSPSGQNPGPDEI